MIPTTLKVKELRLSCSKGPALRHRQQSILLEKLCEKEIAEFTEFLICSSFLDFRESLYGQLGGRE